MNRGDLIKLRSKAKRLNLGFELEIRLDADADIARIAREQGFLEESMAVTHTSISKNKATVYLRSDARRLEVFHELAHVYDAHNIGIRNFNHLSSIERELRQHSILHLLVRFRKGLSNVERSAANRHLRIHRDLYFRETGKIYRRPGRTRQEISAWMSSERVTRASDEFFD